jgi:Arginase family
MLVSLVLHLLASCVVLASQRASAEDDLGETAQHRFDEGLNRADDLDDEEYHSRFGPQVDLPFSGPLSFAHLPYSRCLDDLHSVTTPFDIAILGMPFDTAVTYRPGARFGPYGIRSGSRRLGGERAYSLAWESSPYTNATKVIDCGDVSSWFLHPPLWFWPPASGR